MRLITSIAAATLVLASLNCQAATQWTPCVNVVGVANYLAPNDAIVVAISPPAPGCQSNVNGTTGTITFKLNVLGVTAAYLNPILASLLTAYTTGRGASIYYDNGPGCFGTLIVNGGSSGDCP